MTCIKCVHNHVCFKLRTLQETFLGVFWPSLVGGDRPVVFAKWHQILGNNCTEIKHVEKAEDAELALRRPHLEKALADVKAAEADERQARLQLERTAVSAPFNAIITTINVNIRVYGWNDPRGKTS